MRCLTINELNNLKLPQENRDRLINLLDFIYNCEYSKHIINVYLFGSYAKERIHSNSDIDLIITTNIKDLRDLSNLKIKIFMHIEDKLNIYYGDDFDLLLYSDARFNELITIRRTLEYDINKYMIKIERR